VRGKKYSQKEVSSLKRNRKRYVNEEDMRERERGSRAQVDRSADVERKE
jgi:hypothetical protein